MHFIFLIFILLPISGQSQINNDTCENKIFHYSTYKMKKNIEVISDSTYFNKYFIFKINLKEINENRIPIEIYLTEDLNSLFDWKNLYYFMPFNYYMYADIIGFKKIDSLQYSRITNSGTENKESGYSIYFDRLDLLNKNPSYFRNLFPWSTSSENGNVFYIFKTSLNGVLIENDIKRNRKTKHYINNVKVLIPFERFLPLTPVSEKELENSHLIKRKQIKICAE